MEQITDFKIAQTMNRMTRFKPSVLSWEYPGHVMIIADALKKLCPKTEKILGISKQGTRFDWKDHIQVMRMFPDPSGRTNIFPSIEKLILRKKELVNSAILGKLPIFSQNPKDLKEKIRQQVNALFPEKTRKKDKTIIEGLAKKLRISRIKEDYVEKLITLSLTIEDINKLYEITRIGKKELIEEYNQLLEMHGQGHKKLKFQPKKKKSTKKKFFGDN